MDIKEMSYPKSLMEQISQTMKQCGFMENLPSNWYENIQCYMKKYPLLGIVVVVFGIVSVIPLSLFLLFSGFIILVGLGMFYSLFTLSNLVGIMIYGKEWSITETMRSYGLSPVCFCICELKSVSAEQTTAPPCTPCTKTTTAPPSKTEKTSEGMPTR